MLRDEILRGPLAAELAPHVAAGADGRIAEILNRADAGVILLPALDAGVALACVDPDELDALSTGHQRLLDLAMASGTVPRTVWERCFPDGSTTRVRLESIATEPASRAMILGVAVTAATVAAAFRADRDEAEVRALAVDCKLSGAEADALVASAKTPSEAARQLIESGKKVREPNTVVRADLVMRGP